MKKRFLIPFLIAIVVMTIYSCTKSDTTPAATADTNTTSATDNNTADTRNAELNNIGSQAIESNGNTSTTSNMKNRQSVFLTSQSGSVTITGDSGIRQFTVTFNAFVGPDGILRNGTILYDYHSSYAKAFWYRDSGLVLNITTPGNTYTVNGDTVKIISKTIRNIGRITEGNLTWNDNANISIVKSLGRSTILWQCTRTTVLLNTNAYTYTADDGTSNSTDYPAVFHGYTGGVLNCITWPQAILSFSGTFSGTASDGETYSGSVSSGSPLILNFNCTPPGTRFMYVSGILSFTPTGKLTRTINYGNGVCDLTFNIAIGPWNTNVTL